MTNREWLMTLDTLELANNIRNNCRLCIHRDEDGCCNGELKCIEGILKWLEQKHKEEAKPCPVCRSEMNIRWQHSGCYLVCSNCDLYYGLHADIADGMGIIEGGYRKEEALIADWNRRISDGK